MKALQILKPGHAEVIDLPLPEPGKREVRVKVLAVTTCPQWDLHIFYGRPMFVNIPVSYPFMVGHPGHEMTGIVDAVGLGAKLLKVGDRVSVWRDHGPVRPGCYAQYVVFDEEGLIKVPKTLDPVSTAPLELAMCVSSSIIDLVQANAIKGKRVGISGLGSAGLVAAQLMKAEGASEIIGFDIDETRREYARPLLSHIINPTSDEGKRLPLRNQAAPLLDVSMDCIGVRESVEYLMDHTKEIVSLFGVQRENYTYGPGHWGLKIFGYPGHYREAAEYALRKITDASLNLKFLVTHQMKLEEYKDAVELLKTKCAIKVCFMPNE